MSQVNIYLRLRNRHYTPPNKKIYLGQIAQIIAPDPYEQALKNMTIYQITEKDQHLVVIDMMQIIDQITDHFPEVNIQMIGNSQIIVEILTSSMKKKPSAIAVALVWLLLFIGSGLAIMNFHHDVSMEEVHKRLYYLITGVKTKNLLLLQIPYSLGIGIGMILFFNHLFKKKINEEPSPLEVEMFLYQQNLDRYVVINENEQNGKKNQ